MIASSFVLNHSSESESESDSDSDSASDSESDMTNLAFEVPLVVFCFFAVGLALYSSAWSAAASFSSSIVFGLLLLLLLALAVLFLLFRLKELFLNSRARAVALTLLEALELDSGSLFGVAVAVVAGVLYPTGLWPAVEDEAEVDVVEVEVEVEAEAPRLPFFTGMATMMFACLFGMDMDLSGSSSLAAAVSSLPLDAEATLELRRVAAWPRGLSSRDLAFDPAMEQKYLLLPSAIALRLVVLSC